MIPRHQATRLRELLRRFPAVALIGSRQSGKTTLAKAIAAELGDSVYLDLELPSDLAKLQSAELFLSAHADELVVIDEVQNRPQLFAVLRALIDRDRRSGRYLILGSAGPDLLRQSAETLAGRVAYLELPPFLVPEVGTSHDSRNRLWARGGYPDSVLAASDEASLDWRRAFVRTFLERDLPQLGVRTPAARLRRFWQMLAHWHGCTFNAAALARNFDVSAPTVRGYLDLLTDTFVVRQLQPFHANLKKRLVKSPKVYLRDSGLLHALLDITDVDMLHGHPTLGASFEGFCVEQIAALLPDTATANFFATHSGPELDLVVTFDAKTRIAIDIKYTDAPKLPAAMRDTMRLVGCERGYIVTAGRDAFPLADEVDAMPIEAFIESVVLGDRA